MKTASDDRTEARLLYWQGYRIPEITRRLSVPGATLHSWKRRDDWDSAPVVQRVEQSIDARLCQLLKKDEKTDQDLKEIEVLTKSLERTARIRRYDDGGNEADLNPNVRNRNRGKRRSNKKIKNDISPEALDRIKEGFMDEIFGYQKEWLHKKTLHRIRNILKSRQIGATYYFSNEALVDAATTGDNQIFISASKAQAHVFRNYVVQAAKKWADVELTGDPIVLPNGAELIFLSTNSNTAQSYHGHLYVDEYFWIQRFQNLRKVASGMAAHKKWRQTYFSTPSSVNHEAYPFWTGALFNRGRKKEDQIQLDVSHKKLAPGRMCEDGQWRQIVTLLDAEAKGCDLFDIEQLRLEYSPEEMENLFMCQFVDDTFSVFSFTELTACMVDSWVAWDDFKPLAPRPIGNRDVWIGYDPSRTSDNASCVVVAPSPVPGGKHRILDKLNWVGMDFVDQAERIKRLTEIYNVTHIGIDKTAIGTGVFDMVRRFFPRAVGYDYNPAIKAQMVLKTKDIISHGRLEFDNGWTDMVHAMLMIKRTMTAGGGQMTYQASRTNESGHADLAWALMHALDNAPLHESAGNNSILELF
ncbi:terminase large subunit domain-containing protein [Spongiibacter marinus]|uniref:terminase large subunit domain-containing protein n=1 Tax=Spongiibacter marinus TaxID=354246 RepID=UPI00195F8465|nr:terminase family protein [Spongiibacter marinus]MBM7423804.1 uncharacterized protein YjcR [Spongiibacter marinus]